jgi:hypothetical protein
LGEDTEDMTDPITPRLAGEGPKAYAAFCAYRDLGPTRTLEAVRWSCGSSTAKSLRLMERWSGQWGWVERCRAWDARIEAVRLAARLQAAAEMAATWERRRQKSLEDAWSDAEALRVKALEMLTMATFVEVTTPDGSVTRRPTGKWSFGTAGDLIRIGIELKTAVLNAATAEFETLDEVSLRAISDAVLGEAGPTGSAPSRDAIETS